MTRTRRVPGVMNALEQKLARHLDDMQRHGEIMAWRYEPIRFVLADRTTYCPDFLVVNRDETVSFWECKPRSGDTYFAREDAKLKARIAAEMYPFFQFLIVWPLKGSGWDSVELKAGTTIQPPTPYPDLAPKSGKA